MLSHAIRSCLNFSQYKFQEEFSKKRLSNWILLMFMKAAAIFY